MDTNSSVSAQQINMHKEMSSNHADEKKNKQHQIEVKLIQLEDLYGALIKDSKKHHHKHSHRH